MGTARFRRLFDRAPFMVLWTRGLSYRAIGARRFGCSDGATRRPGRSSSARGGGGIHLHDWRIEKKEASTKDGMDDVGTRF